MSSKTEEISPWDFSSSTVDSSLFSVRPAMMTFYTEFRPPIHESERVYTESVSLERSGRGRRERGEDKGEEDDVPCPWTACVGLAPSRYRRRRR
jgi:hypothetical protein